MSDDLLERLGRGCNCGRCKLDLCCCAAMEEAKAEIEKLRGELRQIEVDAAETYNDWCEAGCDAKDAIRFAFDIGTYCRAALGETK